METIVGASIVAICVVLLVVLTIWSRSRINNLAEKKFPNARKAFED